MEIIHHDGRDPSAAALVARDADVAVVVVGYTKRDEGEFVDPAGVQRLFHLFPPMTDPDTGRRRGDGRQRDRDGALAAARAGAAARLDPLAVRERGGWTMEPGDYLLEVARFAGDPEARSLRIPVR